MTVEELVWQLTDMPADAHVFVRNCCCGGLDDLGQVELSVVALDAGEGCAAHTCHDPNDSYDVKAHSEFVKVVGVVIG